MIRSISARVADFLFQYGHLDEKDREIYVFGLVQSSRMLLNIVIALAVGCIMGMPWQAFLFLASFIPIRSYGGGFHAATPIRCYVYSVAIIVSALASVRLLAGLWFPISLLVMVSVVAILALAPVGSNKKPLSDAENAAYRCKSARWLAVILAVVCVLLPMASEAALCLLMALVAETVLLILGKISAWFYDWSRLEN